MANTIYECKLCGIIIKKSKFNFERHLKTHDTPSYLQCPKKNCKLTFRARYNLKKHYIEKHGGKLPENVKTVNEKKFAADSVKLFRCPYCGSQFRHRYSNLSRHIENVHKKIHVKVPCAMDGCTMLFYSTSNMKRHFTRAHKGKVLVFKVLETAPNDHIHYIVHCLIYLFSTSRRNGDPSF